MVTLFTLVLLFIKFEGLINTMVNMLLGLHSYRTGTWTKGVATGT